MDTRIRVFKLNQKYFYKVAAGKKDE